MMRTSPLKQTHLTGINHQSGDQCDNGQHDQNSQQEQQDLLDENPSAVALLALEQKLHGCELNAPIPQAVDQMNDDRRRNQRRASEHECRVQEVRGNPGFHVILSGFRQEAVRPSMSDVPS